MGINYPGSVDDFADPTEADHLGDVLSDGRKHSELLRDIGDAVVAIEQVLGNDPDDGHTTVDARISAVESDVATAQGDITTNAAAIAGKENTGVAASAAAGAISTHLAASDPHTQYHTNARGDVRYYTKTQEDAQQVRLTGTQTIAGTKTFSSAPSVPDGSFTVAKTTGLQTSLDDLQANIDAVDAEAAAKADTSDGLDQFADVSDTAPTDGQMLRYDGALGYYVPIDLGDVYAEIGSDLRIVPSAYPPYNIPLLTINEGDTVPSTFPTGGWVAARPASLSLIPTSIGYNDSGASTTVAVTTTTAVAAGEYIIFSLATSDETTQGQTLTSVTYSGSAAGTYVSLGASEQAGTASTYMGYCLVTTDFPAGTVITWTVSASRTHLVAHVSRAINIAASTPTDGTGTGGGSSSSTFARTIATITTANPNDVAFMTVGYNSGTSALSNVRSIVGAAGWTQLGPQVEHVGTSSNRSLGVFYQVLTTAGSVPGAVTFTGAGGTGNPQDSTTGSFSGVVAALRSA